MNDDTGDTIAIETAEGETPEAPQADETTPEAAAEDEDAIDDEVEVSIGDKPVQAEEPKQAAPAWVRELRRRERDLQREVRELRAKAQAPQQGENQPPAAGAKPKLEDHDYDAERFETALSGWFERKRHVDKASSSAEPRTLPSSPTPSAKTPPSSRSSRQSATP